MGLKTVNNESDLLKRINRSDEKAFEELFMAYHNQLGEYVFMLTRSRELTEEIIQDVFIKVWQNREKVLLIEKFTSYLFILTRNYVLNAIRKLVADHKRKQQYDLQLETGNDEIVSIIEQEQDMQLLIDKAVSLLPPQQQKVFLLRIKGLKNPDIAVQMNISIDSVKKYQQLALKSVITYVRECDILSALIFLLINLEKYDIF